MPNIKSVVKDVTRSRERRLRNNAAKSRMKTFIKKANAAIAVGEPGTVVPLAVSVIDRTAKRGIIHRNAARRRKSRLMKRAAAAVTA